MATIDQSSFSTRDLPANERLATWRESIATLFDIRVPPDMDAARFNADLTSWLLDERVMLSRCRTTAQRFRREPLRIARDGLDHYLIQTHMAGSQRIRRGGRALDTEPGDLIVIDLADEHAAETTAFTNLTLVVPRPMLAPHLAAPDSQQGRVLKGGQGLTGLAVSHLRMLWDTVGDLAPDAARQVIEPTVTLIASALNGSRGAVADGPDGMAMSLLAQTRHYIERNLHRELTTESLCAWLGVSRATLYRLFEPLGGVRAYIQERRLQRCAQALAAAGSSRRPILDIALSCGFNSQAHFSRAFRQRFGITPTQAREFSASGQGARAPMHVAAGGRDYEHWLAHTLTIPHATAAGMTWDNEAWPDDRHERNRIHCDS
jgi:AraC-like DNA-binding protein